MTDFLNWFLTAISSVVTFMFSLEMVAGVSVGSVVVVGFCFTVIVSILFNILKVVR